MFLLKNQVHLHSTTIKYTQAHISKHTSWVVFVAETLVYPQLQGTSVELYEETKVEVVESRVRTEEKLTEVMTVSTKEQIIVPEKKRTSIIQTPQFPVVPREVDDDWFQLFDKVPYEQKSFPSGTAPHMPLNTVDV